mmetsp:Transcript_18235/g.46169  ORF Transcript_18235/g.46169 Transcript_18235/m.46169 type:complete len:210 (+) Transcript_18235:205-834(+)
MLLCKLGCEACQCQCIANSCSSVERVASTWSQNRTKAGSLSIVDNNSLRASLAPSTRRITSCSRLSRSTCLRSSEAARASSCGCFSAQLPSWSSSPAAGAPAASPLAVPPPSVSRTCTFMPCPSPFGRNTERTVATTPQPGVQWNPARASSASGTLPTTAPHGAAASNSSPPSSGICSARRCPAFNSALGQPGSRPPRRTSTLSGAPIS